MTSLAHPLDPLDPTELATVVSLCRADHRLGDDPRFVWIALAEPDKAALLAGAAVGRRADVVVIDQTTGTSITAEVDLEKALVAMVTPLDGLHASVSYEEWTGADRVLDNPEVAAALALRGIDSSTRLHLEPWPLGFGDPAWGGDRRRLGRVTFFVREHDEDTAWARPVENLVVIADRVTGEVVHIIDGEVVPVPTDPIPIVDSDRRLRDALRPLTIEQSEGPSYTLEGNELSWEGWQLRVGFHPLEGLVLRDITYDDPETGRRRRVAWRASVSEMVVPYGDPSPMNLWRHVFDAGEVGLGKNATSLSLGCDCLGHIDYLDEHMVTEDGSVATIANAVCIHEEDNGVLWRHYDAATDTTEVRRRRRLVVSSWTNLGNYDYGFYWKFSQDGSIEVEVLLSGVVLATALDDGVEPAHGVQISPELSAPHHQHLFSFRLDLDVDGVDNVVEEVDLLAAPSGPDNPMGTALITEHTLVAKESEGQRRGSAVAGRAWYVRNRGVENALGQPVGYKVVPNASPILLASEGSPVAARAAFASHHLWVTAYDGDQMRAAGPFPNQHPGGAGLPSYIANDRNLVDTDIVLWLTCGTNHVARPEDWPVMPAARTGFILEPAGFFARNPALDVRPQTEVNPGVSCRS